jgi:hypothetical protein
LTIVITCCHACVIHSPRPLAILDAAPPEPTRSIEETARLRTLAVLLSCAHVVAIVIQVLPFNCGHWIVLGCMQMFVTSDKSELDERTHSYLECVALAIKGFVKVRVF